MSVLHGLQTRRVRLADLALGMLGRGEGKQVRQGAAWLAAPHIARRHVEDKGTKHGIHAWASARARTQATGSSPRSSGYS